MLEDMKKTRQSTTMSFRSYTLLFLLRKVATVPHCLTLDAGCMSCPNSKTNDAVRTILRATVHWSRRKTCMAALNEQTCGVATVLVDERNICQKSRVCQQLLYKERPQPHKRCSSPGQAQCNTNRHRSSWAAYCRTA